MKLIDKAKRELLKLKYHKNRHGKVLPYDWADIPYNRIDIIQHACAVRKAKNYLEIGCFKNDVFDAISVANKIGVDPEQGGTHRMTSDDFFAENKQKFDVIFIDGLHHYQQVHKDIANAIPCLKKHGFILLHDMLPKKWTHEHVPRFSSYWNGDVWKVAFEAQKSLGLDFKILLADCGVGVIKVNNDYVGLEDMSAELTDKRFAYFYERYKTLPLIEAKAGLEWMQNS